MVEVVWRLDNLHANSDLSGNSTGEARMSVDIALLESDKSELNAREDA